MSCSGRGAWVLGWGAILGLGPWSLASGCSRRVEIASEGQDGLDLGQPTLDAGDIPELDAGFGSDALAPCDERDLGGCQGSVDFPCAFGAWVARTAKRCQAATGCLTDGWLEVTLGPDGCVDAMGMHDPHDAIVTCIEAELESARCACNPEVVKYFFGLGNDGCGQPCGPELPCAGGEACVEDRCTGGGGGGD